ncbi:MAG: tripartite tricarboxylate transporter permease [Alphaproteobacteria bacterium]|nr:tripartite tricarboxylate transporter permease [Alphaproteobacteria bacterium]
MDVLPYLLHGFEVALRPDNLLYCFLGVLGGTLVGVLPGLGPQSAIVLLLPGIVYLDPVSAIIMLAGVYYGSMYGGSTTSILVNIPGEAASVVTCIDGHQMALQGRAGPALGIAAFGSFIAGTFGIALLTVAGAPIAEFALRFGPPEYFSLMCLALIVLIHLTGTSLRRGLISACAGLFLGTIGMDLVTGQPRFTLSFTVLMDGVGLIPMIMGLYGVTEVLLNIERGIQRTVVQHKIGSLLPSRQDWRESAAPIARGTLLGSVLGMLPGAGVVLASFLSYAVERKLSRHPERFGKGAIAGVAGPESANNAAAQCGFIPLLTLGIPANVATTLLLAALVLLGIQPSPMLVQSHPDLFWGTIASMYVGNVMLLVLNLPLIGIWVQVLRVPYALLFPVILLFCMLGVYMINRNVIEIWIMLGFGVIGYIMKKTAYEFAPLVLAMVIAPIFENAFRQSLILSLGSLSTFVTRPISATLLACAALLLLVPLVPQLRTVLGRLKE